MIPNKEAVKIKDPGKMGERSLPSHSLKSHLNSLGMRMTPQKLAVYNVVQRENFHPTPEMVFAEVRAQFPMMSRGTVYQILDQFSRIGIIRRIASSDQRLRFDGNAHPHAHFVCEQCGRIDDIEDSFVETFQKRFARKFKFHIRNHYFEFSGLCAPCAKRSRTKRRLE